MSPSAQTPPHTDTSRLTAILFCLLFFLEGLLFIPYIGLQQDELLFTAAIYPPWGVERTEYLLGHSIPTMLMSYVGALKATLYRGLFLAFEPSAWSVRIPVLVIGILTIWVFFELVRGALGSRTALLATALLATDTMYVLTTCLDWGPVAIQHLVFVSGLFLLWRFHATEKLPHLAGGFFLFGLGLWDKALFCWLLAGLAAAAFAAFPRAVMSRMTSRNLAVAGIALVLGAAPLLLYNEETGFKTFAANAEARPVRFPHKMMVLRKTLDGSALFGYITRAAAPAQPVKPQNPIERMALATTAAVGHPSAGLLFAACLLALALMPWIWNTPARKPAVFALVFIAVTWLAMALPPKGGTGAHHTVLLWPLPQLFVAAVFAQASRLLGRAGVPVLVAVTGVIAISNLAVANEYFAETLQRGLMPAWSDAVFPLADSLRDTKAKHVYTADWGILNPLRTLDEGRLKLDIAQDWFLIPSRHQLPPERLGSPDTIFVGHLQGSEIEPGTAARLSALAQEAGLQKQVLQTFSDRQKRPVFEVYQFRHP